MRTVLVIGGGHAGLEAAFAAARVGACVRLVTSRQDTIGQTPCNPSVGGVAKGHLVREIDAMGGVMGRLADATAIHGRVLNRSKGAAVQATRLQVDKARYGHAAQQEVAAEARIELHEGLVTGFVSEVGCERRLVGVRLHDGSVLHADAIVVTTGTFLGGLLHTGKSIVPGGRAGEGPALGLSDQLRALGFRLQRLKTGTPPRLDARTIDFSRAEPQPSEDPVPRFTLPDAPGGQPPLLPQVTCFLTWTNPQTQDIVREHLHESPMYSGQIQGRGPRYCPALEDKVVRFADRERHQVFLEPEGLDTHSVYPNGISTSLPQAVQARFVATIAGLEHATILRPGYAVEYDAVDARALDHRLASKSHDNLWFAGQVNGTSGYEEAGAQGLVAGANAALWLLEREPFTVARDQGYTGVMVDDLVTQGCDEPYRMFTSRAEFRILLREDNADERLTQLAHEAGLVTAQHLEAMLARAEAVTRVHAALVRNEPMDAHPEWIAARARSRHTYAAYEQRVRTEVARVRGDAAVDLPLPADLDYSTLPGLSLEAQSRLHEVRPSSTAQAARIPGMTPAHLMTLWAFARQRLRRRAADATLHK